MNETTVCPTCRQPLSATAQERNRLERDWVRRMDNEAILAVSLIAVAVIVPILLLEWLT